MSQKRKAIMDTSSWGSPIPLYQHLDKEYHFCADIAASDRNHLHPVYFTKKRSALDYNWSKEIPGALGGYVYMNHPYNNTEQFMRKAAVEWERGVGIVMLAKNPGAEEYWQECVYGKASKMIFITGRLSFRHPDTLVPQKGCNFGSVIVVWRPNREYVPEPVKFVRRDELNG